MKGKSHSYYALIEVLRRPGCPVCHMVDEAVRQRIDAFLYEQITVIARRDEIRNARGFCSPHGSMVQGTGRMLGTAILQHDVLNDVLREIAKVAPVAASATPGASDTGPSGTSNAGVDKPAKSSQISSLRGLVASGLRLRPFAAIANAIKPRRECPLCEYERSTEANLLRTLINNMDDTTLREAFARSTGLCLPHFKIAAGGLSETKPELLSALTEIELSILARLRDELAEYIHKSNGSYDYASMGEESEAPLRAVRTVSGRVIHRDGRE